MKRILVIQSRKSLERQAAERVVYERAAGKETSFDYVSTFDSGHSWDSPSDIIREYGGIILGGSSDFFWHNEAGDERDYVSEAYGLRDRVRLLVEHVVERQVPTFAICLGHQLIAEVFGGAVSHDESQKKVGTYDVEVTRAGEDDVLFAPLAPSFAGQYVHKNSVTRPPLGAVVLANGPSCRFAALRYGERVYTTQFHPELSSEDLKGFGEALQPYLATGIRPEDLFRSTPQANTLIASFIRNVVA